MRNDRLPGVRMGLLVWAAFLPWRSAAAAPLAFEARSYPVAKNGWDMATADLNRDGALDIIVQTGKRFAILRGAGDGTFGKAAKVSGGNIVSGFCVDDFNLDLWPDIALLGSQGVSVLQGTPEGRFLRGPRTLLRYPFMGIASGDLDVDGRLDLVIGRMRIPDDFDPDDVSYLVAVLRGRGDSTFEVIRQFDTRECPSAIVVADFDQDGTLDLAVSDTTGRGAVLVHRGLGGGAFGARVEYPCPRPSSLVAVDLDVDGWPDLALASAVDDRVAVLGGGPAGFAAAQAYPFAELRGCLAAGDLNGDGRPDLVATTGRKEGTAVVLPGLPEGGFGPAASVPVPADPRGIAVADFNGDRRLDLAVSSYATKTLTVLLNAGTWTP